MTLTYPELHTCQDALIIMCSDMPCSGTRMQSLLAHDPQCADQSSSQSQALIAPSGLTIEPAIVLVYIFCISVSHLAGPHIVSLTTLALHGYMLRGTLAVPPGAYSSCILLSTAISASFRRETA